MIPEFITKTPVPVAMFDMDMIYIAYSNGWADNFETGDKDLKGKCHFDLFPQSIEDFKRLIQQSLKTSDRIKIENAAINVNGKVKYFDWIVSPWFKDDADVGGAIIYSHDMTEFLEIQKKYVSMKEAQDLANIGHWELNLKENHLYWSDEVYKIFGLKPQEFIATYDAFLDRIHPEDVEMVNTAYTDSLANKTSYHIVHRVVTIDDELKYVEERCLHDFDSTGNVKRSIGTVHDITESVSSKQQIELASKVFDNTQEGIIITDSENKIIKVNDAYTKITGFTAEELIGKNPRSINSGWQNEEFYTSMWETLLKKGYWNGELLDRKKNGELFEADLSISTVKDKNNNILNFVAIISDISEKKENESKIHKLAYYDFLTNLPNKTLINERIDHSIKTHGKHKQFALLLMDIDDFKIINDTLGHKLGDEFLIGYSKRLKNCLTEDVTFGRLGGDEFLAVIEDISDIRQVTNIANRLTTEASKPFVLNDNTLHFTISIGISVYPLDGYTFDTLITNADTAMYNVKKTSKSTFKYFTNGMNNDAHKRLLLDTALRKSIENNEMTVFYQPKVSTSDETVLGLEALLRWKSKEFGHVSPADFITIAEDNGFIHELGKFVFTQACNDMNDFIDIVGNRIKVSVNVSGVQFRDPFLNNEFSQILKARKICPHNLELEITESTVISNYEEVVKQLLQLKNVGFSLSLDDFGTGYSSLIYLKKLPIDIMKIDKSFINDIETEKESYEIVRATIFMAKALGLSTVAEGVESKEQVKLLKDIGCDLIQGYYYSKPLPKEELITFLNMSKNGFHP